MYARAMPVFALSLCVENLASGCHVVRTFVGCSDWYVGYMVIFFCRTLWRQRIYAYWAKASLSFAGKGLATASLLMPQVVAPLLLRGECTIHSIAHRISREIYMNPSWTPLYWVNILCTISCRPHRPWKLNLGIPLCGARPYPTCQLVHGIYHIM